MHTEFQLPQGHAPSRIIEMCAHASFPVHCASTVEPRLSEQICFWAHSDK